MQHPRILWLLWQILLPGLLLSLPAQAQYVYHAQLGAGSLGLPQFGAPAGVVVDAQGNLYVTDNTRHVVHKVSAAGQVLLTIGSYGDGNGQFNAPSGIARDGAGNLYVADAGNNRVQKFGPDGAYLASFGAAGSEDGQFYNPTGVAVDAQGNLYVADGQNHRVQKLRADGSFLAKFGSFGSVNGQFATPVHVALDGRGNLFVSDLYNHRVQKFTTAGTFLAAVGQYGSAGGELSEPGGLVVDAGGNLYVSEGSNHRVQQFSPAGRLLASFGTPGAGNGQFKTPAGLALDGFGNLYVADGGNGRVQKLSNNGQFLAKVGGTGNGDGQFNNPAGVAVDARGNVFVSDQANHRVQKFNAAGQFLAAFGKEGKGDGEFSYPAGLALDKDGNLYVADQFNHRIQKFSGNGTFLAKFGREGSGKGQFAAPAAVAVDAQGNLYVADQFNHRVQKLSPQGTHLANFGTEGWEDGQFNTPTGVAVDAQGNVYVAAYGGSGCLHKFKSTGRFTETFGLYGTEDGRMNAPAGLAVDAQNNLYASDAAGHYVQVYQTNGKFTAKVGGPGTGNGLFDGPAGVTPDGQGGFYAADFNQHRVQQFVPGGDPEVAVRAGALALDKDSTYDFGTTAYANPVSTTFTLDNSAGEGTLLVSGLTLPAGFALVGDFPVGVRPGGKATFTVQQTATAPGDFTGTLSFVTNDADENPYRFTLRGKVTRAPQEITFRPLENRTYGGEPFALSASVVSGLPVVYTSSNPAVATVSGNVVTLTGIGTTTITASQAGNENYLAAAPVQQPLTVVLPSDNIWTGTNAWTATAHWSNGSIPTTDSDATVATGVATVQGTAGVRNLTLNPGATVHVPHGGVLVVAGDLTNRGGRITGPGTVRFAGAGKQALIGALALSGVVEVRGGTTLLTNNDLILESGAILLHGGGTPNGGGKVSGEVIARRDGKAGNAYNGWSSPVSEADATLLGGQVYRYDESKPYENFARWIPFAGTLEAGTGYFANGAGSPAFIGTPHEGTISVSLQRTAKHPAGQQGYNLVGNPYPGPLDYNAFIAANPGINGALYFWDDDLSGGTGYDNADYAVRTAAGLVAGPNSRTVAGNAISSHQGFFVEANASGRVIFTNAMRTGAQNASFFRTKADEIGRLKLSVTGEGKYNETLVAFAADATEGADRLYDARKLPGAGLAVFSTMQDEDYAIQALPLLTERRTVPLGVVAATAGSYAVGVAALENLADDVTVLLEDKQTGLIHDLRQDTTVAVQLAAGRSADRFVLHFGATLPTTLPTGTPVALPAGTPPVPGPPAPQPVVPVVMPAGPGAVQGIVPVQVFAVGRTIYVRPADPSVPAVSGTLFNLRGESVQAFTAEPVVQGQAQLRTHAPHHQVYILRLSTGTSVVTRRVYLGE